MNDDRPSICLNCIYGSQPYGYYPIVCVHGRRSRNMYHDKTKCKHFEACPDENHELNEPMEQQAQSQTCFGLCRVVTEEDNSQLSE